MDMGFVTCSGTSNCVRLIENSGKVIRDNIKMNCKVVAYGAMGSIHLTVDKETWLNLVNMLMKLWVL